MYPLGVASYSPTGVRLLRFNLACDGWIDPWSVRLSLFLRNNTAFGDVAGNVGSGRTASAIQLLGPPNILFSRARLLSGAVLEDQMYHSRGAYLWQKLLRDRARAIDDVLEAPWAAGQALTIPGGQGRWMLTPLMFGMLNQNLYIPGKTCPLTTELELVSDPCAILNQLILGAAPAGPYN